MEKKTTAAVAVLAVIILIGASYVVISNNDKDGGDDDKITATGRVPIYGNVNNDDYLNSADLTALKQIVKDKEDGKAWDKTTYPYADANHDGDVTSEDVTYLETILEKKVSTKLYYVNTWGTVSSCNYPDTTKGNIGTMYWEQASLTVLLGLWNTRVTACGSGSLSDLTNPGWSELYSYDSNGGKGYNASVETVLASATNSAKVVSLVAYMQGDGTAKDIYDAAIESGSTMNVLVPSNANDLSYVLTMGILLGAEEKAQEYVSIVDGNIEYMKEKTAGYTSETAPTVMVVMLKAATTTSDILVLGPSSTGSANGLYKYMVKTPSKVIEPDPATSFYTQVTADWIVQQNPDYILFCSSGLWSSSDSDATVQSKAQAAAEKFFGGTQAYKNGHIICTANGTMNSFIGGFAFLDLIQTIYPEIDASYASEMYASYFKDGDGWVNYNLEDSPTYKIRVVGASS